MDIVPGETQRSLRKPFIGEREGEFFRCPGVVRIIMALDVRADSHFAFALITWPYELSSAWRSCVMRKRLLRQIAIVALRARALLAILVAPSGAKLQQAIDRSFCGAAVSRSDFPPGWVVVGHVHRTEI
jgi:hypothetical protein